MYTSGQFAGMFRVSKKLLRHYHDIGLMVPSKIDPLNGYLYYDQFQAEKMKKILYLRSLHFPLNEIKYFLETSEKDWSEKIHDHLSRIRREQRVLNRVETELILIENKFRNGEEFFLFMDKKPEFNIRVFYLENPIYVIGRAARIVHGSPEHGAAIGALVENYFGDDVPSIIPNRKEPIVRFGICAEFTPETREFTYIMGDQIIRRMEDAELPSTTRSYIIPSGDYACVSFSAHDIESVIGKTLDEGYNKLFGWLENSEEWVSTVGGTVAYEVYDDERFEVPSWPEMDIWTPVKRKDKQLKEFKMNWNDLFPKDKEPTMEDIANYMGEAKELWLSLVSYFDSAYKASPKITYSGCGMKPGWNVKFQKSGQAFGTIYPQENAFDVMVIISYKLDTSMELILSSLSEKTSNLYRSAGDYMKIGKWMTLRIDNKQTLEDYKKIIAVKLPPK